MLGLILAASLTKEQLDCSSGGSEFHPEAIYSPPAGVISVSTSDGQIRTFQYPPGTEHYRLGCYCNGWGIGYSSGSSYGYTHNDASLYGVNLVSSTTLEWGPTYRWRVVYRTADGYFTVTHNFSYCTSTGALHVASVITNTSGSTQYGVKFKRYIDWDVNPGYFSSNYFYRTSNMCYAASSDNSRYVGLTALSPTPNVIELYAWDHYYTYTSSFDYASYNGDGYCLLDWSIGAMASGESQVIDYCYVAASSYGGLLAARDACASCPLGSDEDLSVGEIDGVSAPTIRVVVGGVVVDDYNGKVAIFSPDGRLIYDTEAYRGGIIPLIKGLYVIKTRGHSTVVIVR